MFLNFFSATINFFETRYLMSLRSRQRNAVHLEIRYQDKRERRNQHLRSGKDPCKDSASSNLQLLK